MTTLYELVDQAELERLMSDGRIKKQVHPDLPISIYNYTARAQYVGQWLNSERVCRGLIVEDGTNKVIARGPSKFMNYGDPKAPEVTMDTLVSVTRKEDGSLGIGWKYEGHYGIATRGSFLSEQAVHATAKINDEIHNWINWTEEDDCTVIYEIVYPDNRIVLDYKGRDELIRLGNVNNVTGLIGHRGDVLTDFMIRFEDALKMKIPHDEEGYVLDILDEKIVGEGRNRESHVKITGHLKLKGEEYKILHGLLTNTSARRIWVQLAARACHQWIERDQDWASRLKNDPEDFKRVDVTKDIVDTFLTNVPDEFYDWVTRQIDSMNDKVSDLVSQSIQLSGRISLIEDKRARFEAVQGHPMCMEILRYVDSRDESNLIIKAWSLAKPEGDDTPFKTQTEED